MNTKTAISIAGAISQVCADNRKLTWLEAMGQLRELGFIETKTAPGQEFAYAPIVNPMIAVLLGVVLGGEVLGLREGVATAVIVGSVILLTREKRRV